jgi:hypothetical protein
LLRRSFSGIVPEVVLQQKGKYGFPSPIDHALQKNEEGRQLFFDLLPATDLLLQKETAQLGQDFYAGKVPVSLFWRTLSYMIWYQQYFNNNHGKA